MKFPEHCVMWPGKRDRDGYGVLSNKRNVRAHRFMFELFRGAVGPGQVVMHACDTPSCVNPAHLSLGTQADNMADRDRKGRRRNGQTKLTPANVAAIRAGMSRQDAMQSFGIGQSAYYAAKSGETHALVNEHAQWLLNEAEA